MTAILGVPGNTALRHAATDAPSSPHGVHSAAGLTATRSTRDPSESSGTWDPSGRLGMHEFPLWRSRTLPADGLASGCYELPEISGSS